MRKTIIEIDQSGKVEVTAKRTVIGDSKGNFVAIKGVDKRRIERLYRLAGQPRLYVLHLFSLLVTLLIKQSCTPQTTYILDIEYPGKDAEIKDYILYFSIRTGIIVKAGQIRFKQVGKASMAHATAHKAYTKKQILTISLRKLLPYLLPQKRTELL